MGGRKISHFEHEYEFKTDRMLEIPEDIRVKAVERGICGEELESFMLRIRHKISDIQRANSTDISYRLVDTADGAVGKSGVVTDFCGFCADIAFAAYDIVVQDSSDCHDYDSLVDETPSC